MLITVNDLTKMYKNIKRFVQLDLSFTGSYTNLNTTSPSNQLFDYMLNHDKLYGMRAIRMVSYSPDDSEAVSIVFS